MEGPRSLLFDHCFQCLCEVGYDFDWFVMSEQSCPEERSGCWEVASFGDVDVNDLAVLIYGAVDVSAGPGDFDVGFVNEPAVANAMSAGPSSVEE